MGDDVIVSIIVLYTIREGAVPSLPTKSAKQRNHSVNGKTPTAREGATDLFLGYNSMVECHFHTVNVIGSSPVIPTTNDIGT